MPEPLFLQGLGTFFIILNTIAQKGTKPIGLIPSLQAVFQLLSFSSPFQIPFLSTYHPSVPRPYVHIRAEVIKYDDYIRYGSEAAVKEAGKLGVEGKEYVVQDGDIMHFRFNV